MSYPPPPGAVSSSHGPSHPSLPARPPPPKQSKFKSAFSPAGNGPTATTYAPSYSTPTTVAPQQYGASYGPSLYGPAPPTMNAPGAYGSQTYSPSPYAQTRSGHQPHYGGPTPVPAIRNPFPAPGQSDRNTDYDPEMAAQIAQWQSAYTNPDATVAASVDNKTGKTAMAAAAGPVPYGTADPSLATAPNSNEKKKTVVREGGGKKWQDDTLTEWDPSHFRLFVGNLAGETTDESLLKAFARWKSVSKARVVRDKRTTKSKGYGFVSFSDADEFFEAAKEMNGKYIQSHPVIVKRSTTEIKSSTVKNNRHGNYHGQKNKKDKNRQENFEPRLGPQPGGGIHKPAQKTKGGLKLLG